MSDAKQVEDELEEVNRFLDAVVENIPDMIFVKRAEDLMFVRFNRAGEELLGWSRKELVGKTDHDFYPKEQADFFHAKDRETLSNKVLVDIPEEPIKTSRGEQRWLHTKKVPILDDRGEPKFLLGISEDITERKLADQRARAAEQALASIVRNASEAMIAWTPDGKIVTWNPAAESLFGISASDAIDRDFAELLPDLAQLSNEVPLCEISARRSDGRELELEV